jgi:DNA-binding NarL/FixJ family response regulator
MQVVAESSDGEEAVRKSHEAVPDVVLMDITMPGMSGLEATQRIKNQTPRTKILALTMHENEHYLYKMLRAGANGYVPKKAAYAEVLNAIRATYRGEHFIHSSMTAGLVTKMLHEKKASPIEHPDQDILGEGEKEVLRLLAMGHTNQEVADKLYLSVRTIEAYKARLKKKLGLKGRAELLRYAIQSGLLDIES